MLHVAPLEGDTRFQLQPFPLDDIQFVDDDRDEFEILNPDESERIHYGAKSGSSLPPSLNINAGNE